MTILESNKPSGVKYQAQVVVSEADFQRTLIEYLQVKGWKVCEFRKARIKKEGVDVYRTPFGADGEGMPDLIAVKPPRVLFIEGKSDKGKLSGKQKEWRTLLLACPGVEYLLARPSDWESIVKIIEEA